MRWFWLRDLLLIAIVFVLLLIAGSWVVRMTADNDDVEELAPLAPPSYIFKPAGGAP